MERAVVMSCRVCWAEIGEWMLHRLAALQEVMGCSGPEKKPEYETIRAF